jgi:hypothetical protein
MERERSEDNVAGVAREAHGPEGDRLRVEETRAETCGEGGIIKSG